MYSGYEARMYSIIFSRVVKATILEIIQHFSF
jgi:hypothetical protein